jgi:hypothetical protein
VNFTTIICTGSWLHFAAIIGTGSWLHFATIIGTGSWLHFATIIQSVCLSVQFIHSRTDFVDS